MLVCMIYAYDGDNGKNTIIIHAAWSLEYDIQIRKETFKSTRAY